MSALHGNFVEDLDDPPAAVDTAEPGTKEFKALVKLLELKFGEYDIQSMTDAKKIIKAQYGQEIVSLMQLDITAYLADYFEPFEWTGCALLNLLLLVRLIYKFPLVSSNKGETYFLKGKAANHIFMTTEFTNEMNRMFQPYSLKTRHRRQKYQDIHGSRFHDNVIKSYFLAHLKKVDYNDYNLLKYVDLPPNSYCNKTIICFAILPTILIFLAAIFLGEI